ncbi:tetratricopeptide repeat protein [Chryseobacterium populi]|uniref:Response regulator containing a CheY-like receiver domain and an HTH DNA-binding domain n=1 Tax=Chryseobacterium populi TaxID=1144316 RepID=J2JQI2_9FLAO|nr:chemotaxis protein CheY [Chryseobacterium populi]EJL70040.1 response regulator containing a CheY-like receiver domain and an HTH DNA-binding domain [Chryseobacterium populi]
MVKVFNSVKNSFLFFILLLLSNLSVCRAQNNEIKKIDELLQKSENSFRNLNDLDQLRYAKQANVLARKINNSQRITESYFSMARSLSFLEMQKESFIYISKASEQPYSKKSTLIQAQLKDIKVYNYYHLGLHTQAKKELTDIVNLLKDDKSKKAILLLQKTYLVIGLYKTDSARYYAQLCFNKLKQLPEKEVYLELSDLYRGLGTQFLKNNKDSSFYYFNKSLEVNKKYHHPVLLLDYIAFGDYYSEQKEYKEAISYYQKAIQNIKEQSATPELSANNDLYKKISDLYGKTGEKQKQAEYEQIYFGLQKKLISERTKNINYALHIILNDKQDQYKDSERRDNMYILIGTGILLIMAFLGYKLLRKNSEKKIPDTETADVSQENNPILYNKTPEIDELQITANPAYHEVMELAKNNDASFYFRFQEAYPEFQKKLLEYNPGLRVSELTFCAYLFLGFNTKDIAKYTFKSVHTIRNRKQNIRKKFNIQSDQDAEFWLINLIKTKKNS